jgi:sec-independent protein translocase protein TatB
MMFGHFPELVIVLVIGLIIFGPEKVPEMAANAGKMMRDFRSMMDEAMHPHDTEVPDDFSSYYYESLARNGEEVPEAEEENITDADEDPVLTTHHEEPAEPFARPNE